MRVEFSVIPDTTCILMEGRVRWYMKDFLSSSGIACAKFLQKEGEQYMLRADRSSMWLENRVKERIGCGR